MPGRFVGEIKVEVFTRTSSKDRDDRIRFDPSFHAAPDVGKDCSVAPERHIASEHVVAGEYDR